MAFSEMKLTPKQNADSLRKKVIKALLAQGFRIRAGALLPPCNLCKENIRKLHAAAVKHRVDRAQVALLKYEPELLRHIASGNEVDPLRIRPRLVEVLPDSLEALLFRYASLHWSVPVSSGYGRRLRFLVVDDHNGKVVGLIGLADPVFSMRPRDQWIGWTSAQRKQRLRNVMDAFVLGAVPPYSFLLCGKLVAMLATSDTIRHAFKRKYKGKRSVISGSFSDGRLVLITTTSALGRSSVYNRIRFKGRLLYQSVGFTRGWGEFHFSDGLYREMRAFAGTHCKPTAKHEKWGSGFRNRREVIRKCLNALGLSGDWLYHGIEREIFVVPLARNVQAFLQGRHSRVLWYHQSETELFEYFQERWLLPRLSWDKRYRSWSRDDWVIWLKRKKGPCVTLAHA